MENLFDNYISYKDNIEPEKELLKKIEEFKELLNEKEDKKYITKYFELSNEINDLLEYNFILYKFVMRNGLEEYAYMIKISEDRLYDFQNKLVEINYSHEKKIIQLKEILNLLQSDEGLKIYESFIKNIIENVTVDKSIEENTIREMRLFGIDSWFDLYQKSLTKLKFVYKEKRYSYQAYVELLKNEKDILEKEKAYRKLIILLESESWKYQFYLQQIKRHQIYVSQLRGHKNALTAILKEHRMSEKTIVSLDKHIFEICDVFTKYNNRRLLKYKSSVFNEFELYENISAYEGEEIIPFEQAEKIIVNAFKDVNDGLGKFAQKVFDDKWIDYEIREGKLPGSYTNMIHINGKSAISTNYFNNIDSICTVAHEIGHAYHGLMLKEVPFVLTDYPVPIAEIFSLFCENTVYISIMNDSRGTTTERYYKEKFLNNIMQTLQENIILYLFEKNVFDCIKNNKEDSFSEIYSKIKEKLYGEQVSKDSMNNNQWILKSNNFFVDYYYYNFPYVIGMLVSLCLIKKTNNHELGFERIQEFLKNSGCKTFEELISMVDIEIEKEEFWDDIIGYLKCLFEQYASD